MRTDGQTDKIGNLCQMPYLQRILKILFFLERYDTTDLYLIHRVRLYVIFSVRLSLGGPF